MKKLLVVLLFVFSAVLMSCPNPTTEKEEPFSFDGHWNLYNTDLTYHGVDLFFDGDQFWGLVNDKMTAGARFTYTETEFTTYLGDNWYGTQRYDIIDKDTVLFYPPNGNGMSWFSWNNRIKKSGRTGKMKPVNKYWTFVDD